MNRRKKPPARTATAASSQPAGVAAVLGDQLAPLFDHMRWADDEIVAAGQRHRHQTDLLHHAFGVLTPRHLGPGMHAEFVYRAHASELLDRVAAGADLRPATAAELCLVLCEVSATVPLHGAQAGLYFRLWLRAFPDHPHTAELAGNQNHYEQLYGSRIDELEQYMRSKMADNIRLLGDIACDGRHHGRSVSCRFAAG